jgi:hypothetical protein
MTNENPRGLPVAHELREIIGNEYMDETARRRLLAFADRLATDYAALLAERDALRGLLRESRTWMGDGENGDGLFRVHWSPAYTSIIDRIDAAISAMEGGAS